MKNCFNSTEELVRNDKAITFYELLRCKLSRFGLKIDSTRNM